MRRNKRGAPDESSGLPSDIVDLLSEMLKNMGRKLALPNQPPVSMASVCDFLDSPVERIAEEPPVFDVMEDVEEVCEDDDDATREEFESSLEVDDIEPLPPLSLREARGYATRLMEFVTINQDFIKRDGSSSTRDYSNDIDALIQALACVREATRSRQANLLTWLTQSSS
jgi:hypothetical protein